MAPEQLAGTRVTAAADMVVGCDDGVRGYWWFPFNGASLTAAAFAILHS